MDTRSDSRTLYGNRGLTGGGDEPCKGQLLVDRYCVKEELGRGGMGVVYRVKDTQAGGEMALKLVHKECVGDEDVQKLLAREGRAGYQLNLKGLIHPNLVRTLDVGRWKPSECDERPFFVMELVSGRTLADEAQAADEEGIDPGRALDWVAQVADAVSVAHGQGLIHRDLKPGNILIEESTGLARVTDFGIAMHLDGGEASRLLGAGFGSALWAAPEQLSVEVGKGKEGLYTDVYSIGKVLYWILSNRRFLGTLGDFRSLGGKRHLPHAVDDLVRRACALNPEDRFPDMAVFLAALEEVRRQFERLRLENKQDEESDPGVLEAREIQVSNLKARLQGLREVPKLGWENEEVNRLVDELGRLAPDDAEVAELLEVRDDFRRHQLEEHLELAVNTSDAEAFEELQRAAVNLISEQDLNDWRHKFVMQGAPRLAAAGKHERAQALVSGLLQARDDVLGLAVHLVRQEEREREKEVRRKLSQQVKIKDNQIQRMKEAASQMQQDLDAARARVAVQESSAKALEDLLHGIQAAERDIAELRTGFEGGLAGTDSVRRSLWESESERARLGLRILDRRVDEE